MHSYNIASIECLHVWVVFLRDACVWEFVGVYYVYVCVCVCPSGGGNGTRTWRHARGTSTSQAILDGLAVQGVLQYTALENGVKSMRGLPAVYKNFVCVTARRMSVLTAPDATCKWQ